MASATAQRIGVHNTHADIVRRSKGHSVTAAAAYNNRCRIVDERTGQIHDYTHSTNKPLFTGFFPAANAQGWAQDRDTFFNAVEKKENRADSQLARTFIITLPHEMTPEHARYGLQDFIKENFTRNGYGADLAIHPAHEHGDERNLHAHLLVSLRKIDKNGQWAKHKDPSEPNPVQLEKWKERAAYHLNRQLERFGYDIRVDHRSLEARGIDREPEQKLGKAAAAMERDGIETDKGNINREIAARNAERERLEVAELERIAKLEPPADLWTRDQGEPEHVTTWDEAAEIARYYDAAQADREYEEDRPTWEEINYDPELDPALTALSEQRERDETAAFGLAAPESQHVSAIDRQKAEEQEQAREDVIRANSPRNEPRRSLLGALWALTRTMGATLSHIVLGADRGDLMQGRRLADQEREYREQQAAQKAELNQAERLELAAKQIAAATDRKARQELREAERKDLREQQGFGPARPADRLEIAAQKIVIDTARQAQQNTKPKEVLPPAAPPTPKQERETFLDRQKRLAKERGEPEIEFERERSRNRDRGRGPGND